MNRIPDKYFEQFKIPSYLIDNNRVLRPAAAFELAQELAGNGAYSLGMGYPQMSEHHIAWIVSRMRMEFLKPAQWEQKVEFQTWHKGVEQIFFRREYRMLDAATRELLARGTCSWLVMDMDKRLLFRTDRLGEYFDITPQNDESAVPELAPRLRIPSGAEENLIFSHRVRYGDIDFNGHANNTAYVKWAMDCLPEEISLGSYPKVIDINFNRETTLGSDVELYRTDLMQTEFYIEGKVSGVSHFICRIEF